MMSVILEGQFFASILEKGAGPEPAETVPARARRAGRGPAEIDSPRPDVSGAAEIEVSVDMSPTEREGARAASSVAAATSIGAEVGVGDGDDLSVGGVDDSAVGDNEYGGRARCPGLDGVADEVDEERAVV